MVLIEKVKIQVHFKDMRYLSTYVSKGKYFREEKKIGKQMLKIECLHV